MKRKAPSSASLKTDPRPSKRQKTPDPDGAETPEGTTATGLRFLEQLRTSVNKRGEPIATAFLTLPEKDEFPDYYEQIQLPIAIDTIEEKLNNGEYQNMTAVEADMKRMVANAKEYNLPGSPVFNDAERIRKMSWNFMKNNNPAHGRNAQLVVPPTPVDEGPEPKTTKLRLNASTKKAAAQSPKAGSPSGTPVDNKKSRSLSAVVVKEPSQEPRSKDTPSKDESKDEKKSFSGMTFQEAQEKIINDLMEYVEPDSQLNIYEPFVQMPSRTLKDYYSIIKHPTSLKQVMKKVNGWHSRQEVTGVTDMRSWDAFEKEVARIWENTRTYNEDTSEIAQLSEEFEQDFRRRVAEAKKCVEEPAQPKIKLNMSEKSSQNPALKLKLGNQQQSPAPAGPSPAQPSSGSPPLTATGTSQLVNGQAAKSAIARPTSSQARSTASPALSSKTPNGVAATLATTNIPQANGIMPPPATGACPASSTGLHPMGPPTGLTPGPHNYVPQPFHTPTNAFDSKWRPKSSGASTPADLDILMAKLHVTTHPDLPVSHPLRMGIPASKTLSQQSITATVNSQHTIVRLTADLADQLKGPNPRAYRLFVTSNGIRQSQRVVQDYNNLQNGLVNGVNGAAPASKDRGPSWDVRLQPGTNRIEIECVAAAKQSAGNNDLVMEKISLFVFQMKA